MVNSNNFNRSYEQFVFRRHFLGRKQFTEIRDKSTPTNVPNFL